MFIAVCAVLRDSSKKECEGSPHTPSIVARNALSSISLIHNAVQSAAAAADWGHGRRAVMVPRAFFQQNKLVTRNSALVCPRKNHNLLCLAPGQHTPPCNPRLIKRNTTDRRTGLVLDALLVLGCAGPVGPRKATLNLRF